jgi:TolA-binding protein
MASKLTIALAAAAILAAPATAQGGGQIEGRVGRLESEMRAVQRKVFPNGAAVMVEPQITPDTSSPAAAGTPATSAIADLTARVSSLEQQMSSMTGQIEQTQHRLRELEDQFTAYRKTTDARLQPGGSVALPAVSVPTAPRPAAERPQEAASDEAKTDAAPGAVAGVERPSSGDAAEDGYIYGYRLWSAKKYPEAQAQLKKVVADFPKSRRASFAQNLLGRAYLDDGKPSLASIAFYDNYKKYPDGERAAESLYYLGQSLTKLNKPADACKVYGELTDVYGGKMSSAMSADVAKARVAAKCK